MSFGSRLRELRESHELSQAEAGTRCGLAMTWWSQLECGARKPSLPTLLKICKNFPVSADWLLELKPDKP